MIRKLMFLVTTLIFLLTLSTTAFASQSGNFVFYGDSQVGSVSDGQQGYSWNHSDSDRGRIAINKEVLYRISNYDWGHLHLYYDRDGKIHYYRGEYGVENGYQNWDYNGNELNFYIDDNGVSHYFYLNPNRNYEVHQYKDENGITQYSFEDIGWK